MLLIAYDGSSHAQAAVAAAARLWPSDDVLVATAWRPFDAAASAALAGLPGEALEVAVARLDAEVAAEARAIADEGARLARAAGLRARAQAVRADARPEHALVRLAGAEGAEAVVCGARGHGAMAAALLGSVSAGLVRHGAVPVLVVHAPDVRARPAARELEEAVA